MTQYEKIETEIGIAIKKIEDSGVISWIPTDPANSDYQAYLAYVANGNTLPSNSSTPQAGA